MFDYITMLFIQGFCPLFGIPYITWKYKVTGNFPQFLQPEGRLHRQGNYVAQHIANANPDNHWDGRYQCWTTDPFCGVDIGPKRPWLDLRAPEKNLVRFSRDAAVDQRAGLTGGFRGF